MINNTKDPYAPRTARQRLRWASLIRALEAAPEREITPVQLRGEIDSVVRAAFSARCAALLPEAEAVLRAQADGEPEQRSREESAPGPEPTAENSAGGPRARGTMGARERKPRLRSPAPQPTSGRGSRQP